MLLTRVRLVACVGLLLLFAAVPAGHDVWAADGASTRVSGPASPGGATAPAFRLGTAGRPFGWTTAVGDFNADGRPDVIVADRASQWSRNSGYRLDFAISGEAVVIDSIQAPEGGAGIRITDVDHDSDLDVVLASTISGQTIGVWLNDGAGHFTRSDIQVAALAQLTPQSVDEGQTNGSLLSADVPSRRAVAMAPVQARAPAPSTSSPLRSFDTPSAFRRTPSSAAPRAPPVLLPL